MKTSKEKANRAFGKVAYDCCALGRLPRLSDSRSLWAIFSAFQSPSNLFTFPPNFDPRSLALVNFKAVFGTGDVPRYAMNSLIVATSSSLLTVIASSMAGFALAKYRFLGRQFIFLLIISVLLFRCRS